MPVVSHQEIREYLAKRDARLRPLLASLPFPVSRRKQDAYTALLYSIVSQQLSIKAANSIHQRFLELFPDLYPQPEMLLSFTPARLRSAGLSKQKSAYMKNVARFALEQGMDYGLLRRKSDQEVIDYLTQIKGVGKWTVEMLLMFTLNRKDVLPVDDLGIQNAMKALYRLDASGKLLQQQMLSIAEKWRPYRTIVCKYLWKWRRII